MDVQEALRQGEAHLKNALELAKRPVGKEELLYMWDNQITALDTFLAETEVLQDKLLDRLRDQIRSVKKQLTDAVIRFEAEAEGVEVPDEEPSEEEWIASFEEMAQDMLALASEALEEKVKDIQELVKWEEPLAVINGYLADSEPYQELSKDLRRARSLVRAARRDMRGRIDDLVREWRMNQDEDDGDD